MTAQFPRVAFFPDAYHEIDGVAHTARQFEAFAARRNLSFFTIHGSEENGRQYEGPVLRMACRRGRVGFPLDKKHRFDLLFWRHMHQVEEDVRRFRPDIVHITGPSDVGQMAALIAHRLGVPLAASWHTNLHEYAEQRAAVLLPRGLRLRLGPAIRQASLHAIFRFYKLARVLFAPNQELMDLLEAGTGKPCYPMRRGVDTTLFDPVRRDRQDDQFVIGYVGRLTVEKNIRYLAELEQALERAGMTNFHFSIVGQGAEENWLRSAMHHADFAGVLKGEALARAYANMDVFVFPSHTDTFGNVVLEALASGVPAVVTNHGGPKFIVTHGETGFVAHSAQEFVDHILQLATAPDRLRQMRAAARTSAAFASWDNVFEAVYAGYERGLRNRAAVGKDLRVPSRPSTATGLG
jgi:glycosyltransferase involved in cell wall biosynthesis